MIRLRPLYAAMIALASAGFLLSYDRDRLREAKMMMTVLEAQVDLDRADDLVREYREGTSQIPPQILQTFLVRDTRDATRYRIVTVWESEAALQAMRASGVTPKGVQIFQAVGASPELSVYEIIVQQVQ